MEIAFGSAHLAALCSSEERLAQRWDPDTGRTVGRRLLDLAAATATTVDLIPEAVVTANGTDETTITFADRIVVCGVISPTEDVHAGARTDADQIVITSVDVHGSDRR